MLPLRNSIHFVPDISPSYSITYTDCHYDITKLKELVESPFEVQNHRQSHHHPPPYPLQPHKPKPTLMDQFGEQLYSWVVALVVALGLIFIFVTQKSIARNRFVEVSNGDEP